MSYAPYPGGTLLIPTDREKHLFIILTNKCKTHCHLIVNVSSIKKDVHHDTACVFAGGEHPFITHPSFVFYRFAQMKNAQSITDLVAKGYYVEKTMIDASPFTKICEGLFTSKFVKRWVKDYFKINSP